MEEELPTCKGLLVVRGSRHTLSPRPEPGRELTPSSIRLMDKILHDPKDPKLRELWYIPYNGP